MRFTETALSGAWIVDIERRADERGFFARMYCESEFEERGITAGVRQANISANIAAGTLRGLHFQYPPSAENKIVRCIAGAIFDVIVDLRPESATFLQHTVAELSADNRTVVVVPPRFAHGYLTLTPDAEVLYLHSEVYSPADEGGLKYDDPALQVAWPAPVSTISARDLLWPLLEQQRATLERRMRMPTASVHAANA